MFMHSDFLPTVYLLASQRNGTLYTGGTSNLAAQLHQHRAGLIPGFTRDYGVQMLVWVEPHPTAHLVGFAGFPLSRE